MLRDATCSQPSEVLKFQGFRKSFRIFLPLLLVPDPWFKWKWLSQILLGALGVLGVQLVAQADRLHAASLQSFESGCTGGVRHIRAMHRALGFNRRSWTRARAHQVVAVAPACPLCSLGNHVRIVYPDATHGTGLYANQLGWFVGVNVSNAQLDSWTVWWCSVSPSGCFTAIEAIPRINSKDQIKLISRVDELVRNFKSLAAEETGNWHRLCHSHLQCLSKS